MFYWIYDYPTSLIGALFAAVSVGVAWAGVFAFRPFVRSWFHGQRNANDMVGFAFSSFSVLYGLLLGLLAVAAYQNYSSVSDVVTENLSLASLYRDLQGYPEPLRTNLAASSPDTPATSSTRAGRNSKKGSFRPADTNGSRPSLTTSSLSSRKTPANGSSTRKPFGSSTPISSCGGSGWPTSRPESPRSCGGWSRSAPC